MSKRKQELPEKFVVKSNSLVEARYRLGLQEYHVILWLLGQIDANDEDFKSHKMNIFDFCKERNINSGGKYSEMRKITKSLINRPIEIFEPDTQELIQISWLCVARYQLQKGCVILKFAPDLKPYLLQLKSNFTKVNISDAFKLRSVHAIRVFELLLQYQSIGKRIITIEELRLYCGIEKEEYGNYFDLKRKLIQKSKDEINEKTEYAIDYKEIKESRKVMAIEWSIRKKRTVNKLEKAENEGNPTLFKDKRAIEKEIKKLTAQLKKL